MIEKIANIRHVKVILFIISFVLFSGNNHEVSIYILDEAKNASCAREMMETGRYDYPTFNYELRTDKPPLHYFFMIASYKLFGVNPWAARFFSAIFGALTVLLVFHYGSKFHDKSSALWSAVVLLASVHFQLQHHLAVPDPYLIFFVTWSVLLFYSFIVTKKSKYIYLMYSAIALGFLSKGPVSIVIPGLIFIIFLFITKRFNLTTIKSFYPIAGLSIMLVIAAPWFLAVHFRTEGEWTRQFFLLHNLNRYTNEFEGHGGTFLITIIYTLIGMLPFSIYIYLAIKHFLINRKDEWLLLSFIAAVTVVVFFCFSQTRLPNYTVLAYPYISVLIGRYLYYQKTAHPQEFKLLLLFLIVIILAYPAAIIAMGYDPILKPLRYLLLWVLVLPAGTVFSLYLLHKGYVVYSRLNLALTGVLTGLVFFLFIYPEIDRHNPISVSKHLFEGKEVAYYERFNPAYAFELKKPIPPVTRNQMEEFFIGNPNGIIISNKKSVEDLNFPDWYGIVFEHKDVFEIPTTVLIAPFKQ